MAFLPASCVECQQVFLFDEREASFGSLACAACGGEARIVPGCSFGAADREVFHDLSQVVRESTIMPGDAGMMADELGAALRAGAGRGLLERLTVRLPGLVPMQTALGANVDAQRRALVILRSILEGLAMKRASRPPQSSNSSSAE